MKFLIHSQTSMFEMQCLRKCFFLVLHSFFSHCHKFFYTFNLRLSPPQILYMNLSMQLVQGLFLSSGTDCQEAVSLYNVRGNNIVMFEDCCDRLYVVILSNIVNATKHFSHAWHCHGNFFFMFFVKWGRKYSNFEKKHLNFLLHTMGQYLQNHKS